MILIQYYLLFETKLFINYTPAFFKAINSNKISNLVHLDID